MYKPKNYENKLHLAHQGQIFQPQLTVVCWNVAKLSHTVSCANLLNHWLDRSASNLVLFQESRYQPEMVEPYCDLSWVFSANIETPRQHFGVQTLFDWQCDQSTGLITQRQELGLATHKTTLFTTHALAGGEPLLCANIHAINFVPNAYFYSEIARVLEQIKHHTGPILVGGDFNTWNAARVRFIEQQMALAGLQAVEHREPHFIKRFGRHRLDHLFYRGLTLEDAWVVNTARVSDHNPLIARFGVE
ncbi:endonuclease/exonuclease/phosphatase family protein [Halioxenophilus aromaticivorans]|uniref:Endonuclease/exonuclease/phosphatase family protein n=1 Tax=Halioxenophilus aromaticivorans TaxID=1306992 RepID=A0AAV3U0F3_9ALTE